MTLENIRVGGSFGEISYLKWTFLYKKTTTGQLLSDR